MCGPSVVSTVLISPPPGEREDDHDDHDRPYNGHPPCGAESHEVGSAARLRSEVVPSPSAVVDGTTMPGFLPLRHEMSSSLSTELSSGDGLPAAVDVVGPAGEAVFVIRSGASAATSAGSTTPVERRRVELVTPGRRHTRIHDGDVAVQPGRAEWLGVEPLGCPAERGHAHMREHGRSSEATGIPRAARRHTAPAAPRRRSARRGRPRCSGRGWGTPSPSSSWGHG